MKPTITLTGLLSLAWCSWVGAATEVYVEGVFVQANTLTPITQVELGGEVQLIVRVRDDSDDPTGPIGGYVDVTWDSDLLQLVEAIDASEGTRDDVAALFDPPWDDFFAGVKTSAGSLQNIGAGQSPPFERLGGQTAIFFRLTFRTLDLGQANVTLAGRGFGLFGDSELAQNYTSNTPWLLIVEPGEPAPQPTPDPNAPTAVGCFGPTMALGALMIGGCGGLFGRRREMGGR